MTTTTLQKAAEQFEPQRWFAWREAVNVLNLGFHPPESWADEIAAGVQAYIDSEQDERRQRADTNDLFILAAHTGIRMEPYAVTNADLEAWKRATPHWRKQMAKWRKQRAEDADDSLVRERAPVIVKKRLAEAKAKALGNEIERALRSALTARGVVVTAGPVGERHVFTLTELHDAAIGIACNTLTIDGIVFPRVEIEFPLQPSEEGSPERAARCDGLGVAESDPNATLSAGRSDADLREWYITRVNSWPTGQPPPGRDEDRLAAQAAEFKLKGLKGKIAKLRKAHAPSWTKSGPNGRKRARR